MIFLVFLICVLLQVWVVVSAVLLGITILVYLLDKFSPFSYRNRKDHFPDGGKVYSVKESAWFVMGAFTKSGEKSSFLFTEKTCL